LGGKAPHVGQIFRAPGQAEVLRRIAREGRAGFYEGEVAEDMIASLQALGGSHTLDDLAATACDYTTPVSGPYRRIELVEHPPNGQGATAILLLNILKHFDLKAMDPFGPSAPISRPRRPSLPMTPATASSPTRTIPRGSITCCRPTPPRNSPR
jgi:gamma-glutamyltranspeptidase / glutathione hydrolase